MTTHTIDERMWYGDQTLRGSRIVAADAARLRARCGRNAYDHQSHAVVELWTSTGWTEIADRPDCRPPHRGAFVRRRSFPANITSLRGGADEGQGPSVSVHMPATWRAAMAASLDSLIALGCRVLP